ncbi:ecotropic viral integration site 5 ortholog [Chaetodon trifascialis]|uniref:ecotropic viral integration site 5 ortholog n=1 Tax=Chaetodon trifascialis TaxID=109706 RepID=UPI003996ABC8
MLSPSQKNLCDEDSSGSDDGSEVGLEPETDRFGFIVTNGSTAGVSSVGPPPELVRQREAKWINIIGQWDRILLKKTSKVKVQCQKGIPASLRAKCWPLLCGAADRMKQRENLYQSLDSQPALQSWVDVIERDLDRQFPFHEMFLSKDGHGQRGLFRVLKAYTQYQPKEGYCQAQGPVAAVLLMNMPAEEAFWCLVQISEQYLPGYYSPLLEGVLFDAAMLTWVLKRTCPAIHKHLQHHGVEPLMFATDWLMCLFTRHLPFNTLLRVWDLFFCYGVRVLLQVAVVLVRRVLGRAEQRKQCQGQMETLEKLRAVREQVQHEDDAFIAEVCSVPLSARDLEKRTEKELEKWRKDRPSSTFDPRGRCQGYQMAWTRARQSEEEQDRKEREKGNLSVPLARSASTLSLSPSILHKRWRKGGKGNTSEWAGGGRVVRHLSMGTKEDWTSWTELNFKAVQGVQEEDVISEEHKKQSEPKQTGKTEQKEPEKMNIQNTPTEQEDEAVRVKEETEQVETRITEKKERQLEEPNSTMLTGQTEVTNVETEPTTGSAEDQPVENILQQREEPDSSSQSQDLEQQRHKSNDQDTEVQDTKKETESGHTDAVEENQTETLKDTVADTNNEVETEVNVDPSEEHVIQADVKPEECTEIENVQQTQVGTVKDVSEIGTETSPSSETDSEGEAPTVNDPTVETETQQQEVITDDSSKRDAFEGKYHSTESLAETDLKEKSHKQTETQTHIQARTQDKVEENAASGEELEAEIIQTDSEQHETEAETLILCSPECIQSKEDTDFVAEAEIPVSNDTESSEAFSQCSEEECDAVATEPTQEREERSLTDDNQTQAEETSAETQKNEETTDSTAPPQEEVTSEGGEENPTAEPDGKTSSVDMSTTEEPAPEQPKIQATLGAEGQEGSTENVEENTAGEDDVFISAEPAHSNTDSNLQVQHKESHPVKDQTEMNNSSLTQASGHRSSRSSGDFRIRKSSSSHGSRLGRRLSEDLFTMPQKISQSQSASNQAEVKHTESQSNPGAVNPSQSPPDVTSEGTSSPSAEAAEGTEVQKELPGPPKRFGLFRRLRGEQPKKAKAKGKPKMQVPKILIQDFSDGTEKPAEEEVVEKLSSKERRRRRREQERREKEEERLRKKREKEELEEKEKEGERKKPQTRGKSFQVQGEKGSSYEPAKTGSQTLRHSTSYAESYF